MESPWTWSLVAVGLLAMLLTFHVPRAWQWIGIGGLSFFASTLFLDYSGRPDLHPFFTFACDSLVCLALFRGYQEDWELSVFLAFLCSCFASLLMIGGFVREPWIYSSLLELCNLSALLWIGGTGVIDMIGRNENSVVHSWYRRLHLPRRTL